MRLGVTLCLAALMFLSPVSARADIGDYVGRPVGSVVLESDGHAVTDTRFVDLVETHAGAPLRLSDVRQSIAHLFSLGLFEDIRVHAASTGNSVALTYELVPLHSMTSMAFRGADGAGINQGQLREIVTTRFGAAPRQTLAPAMARLVEENLRQAGYLRAHVIPHVETGHGPSHLTLVFEVTSGPRARIGKIDVAGDAGMSVQEVLDRLDLSTGDPYQREALTARLDRYLNDRRRRGFFSARMTVTSHPVDDDQTVNLVVNVSQGPHVKVVFQGDPIPENRHDELVPVAREGAADEDLLEDSGIRIEDYLRAQGYRDAKASFTREEQAGELLITFTVQKGPQYRVARVDIAGNATVSAADFQTRLRVQAGQPFSVAALNADLSTLEDVYHRAGFSAVHVESSTDLQPVGTNAAEVPVAIHVTITENVRTLVESLSIEGNLNVQDAELRTGLGLQPGHPFFLTQLAIDRDAIQLHYANLGYQAATVTSNPGISEDGTQAHVVFSVNEGPRLFVDHVLIVGNERTRTATIERELQFKPGDPLGLEAINESQRRLAALGLFRRARISELGHGDETRRDILVAVEEAPVTIIGYGGGLEAWQQLHQAAEHVASEELEFAPRAFFEVGRRNLFGKNRSVDLFTSVSLRANSESSSDNGFSEYRVIGTYREPRALGTGADAFFTGTLEQQARTSFNFSRRAFNAEVGRRLTPHVSVSGSYQIQRTELFDEQIDPADKLLIDRAFPQIRLSSFSFSGVRDTRDDLADPLTGLFFSANGQLAGRRIGSEVGLAKTYLTAQAFRPLPHTRRAVLATSARLGMATGFPRSIPETDAFGNQERGPDGEPLFTTVRNLPASERFFAGGDTTVRGFGLDQLGAPNTIDKDGFPIGGGGLLIFNAELRVPVKGGFGVVGFVDAGNVFANTSEINLGQLRSALGFGVRYKSPIGPIRVDIGFKTHRQEIAPGMRESPSALHISLGQAF